MKIKTAFLLFVLVLTSSLASFAESDSAFIDRLQTITTLSGKFKQTITDANGKEAADPTSGEFHLKRPGKFYWHTAPPFEQVVVGNEVGLIVYDPDLEQVTVYDREEFLSSPAAVLSGSADKIQQKYSVETQTRKNKHTYVLREKDASSKSFDNLSFVFEKDVLVSLTLKDQLGQTTDIKFDKVKVNQPLEDSIFVFLPPEGADIIVNE